MSQRSYADVSGNYTIPYVNPGTYKVRFGDCKDRAPEWFSDQGDIAHANSVTVSALLTTTANATLARQATLHATAVDPGTNKSLGACIEALAPGERFGPYSLEAEPSVTGLVTFAPLGTTSYTLHVCDGSAALTQDLGPYAVTAGQNVDLGRLPVTMPDSDRDGVADSIDNCPMTANANQADVNNDELGDVCDLLNPGPTKPLKLSVADKSAAEGNNTHAVQVKLKLSAASSSDVTVVVKTADGTAHAGSDYTAVNQTVTIPAGSTVVTVPITVLGDRVVEPDETFTVTLSSPSGAVIGRGTATVTLTNDD